MEDGRKQAFRTEKSFMADCMGFSMMEIILVIAIAGILVTASVSLFGHIRYANTKKTVEEISFTLGKQQVSSMSRADKQILYIYRAGNDYYMRSLTAKQINDAGGSASSLLDASGTKIGSGSIEILASKGGTEFAVSGNTDDTCIKVVYKRSGTYDNAETNIDRIIVRGNADHTITLLQSTGKYMVD